MTTSLRGSGIVMTGFHASAVLPVAKAFLTECWECCHSQGPWWPVVLSASLSDRICLFSLSLSAFLCFYFFLVLHPLILLHLLFSDTLFSLRYSTVCSTALVAGRFGWKLDNFWEVFGGNFYLLKMAFCVWYTSWLWVMYHVPYIMGKIK